MWSSFVTIVSPSLTSSSYLFLVFGGLTAVAVLAQSLKFGLVMDDINRQKPQKPQLQKLPLWQKYVRNCIYSGACDGTDVRVEHAITLGLHLIAAYLVGITFNWPTALLWMIAPTNIQQSVWLNGKRYILAAICVLLAVQWLPWSAVYLPIGAYFHYGAVPALVFAPWALIPAGLAFLYPPMRTKYCGWYRSRYRIDGVVESELVRLTPKKLIVAVKVYGFYFWKVLLPFKNTYFYRFMDGFGISKSGTEDGYKLDWMFVRGLAAIAVTIAGMFTPAKWGLIWWAVFISMWCHLLTHVTQAVADRYTYLASIGLVTALVSVVPTEIYWVVLGLYLISTHTALPQYRDIETFFQYNIMFEPTNMRCYKQYADSLARSGYVQEAWRMVQKGLLIDPEYCSLNLIAAKLMMSSGQWVKAYHFVCKAEANPVLASKECVKHIADLKTQVENKIRK